MNSINQEIAFPFVHVKDSHGNNVSKLIFCPLLLTKKTFVQRSCIQTPNAKLSWFISNMLYALWTVGWLYYENLHILYTVDKPGRSKISSGENRYKLCWTQMRETMRESQPHRISPSLDHLWKLISLLLVTKVHLFWENHFSLTLLSNANKNCCLLRILCPRHYNLLLIINRGF